MLDNGDIESVTSNEDKMALLEGSNDEEDDGPRYNEPSVENALITKKALNI